MASSHPRVVLTFVPAAVLVGLAGLTIWGDPGLRVKQRLEVELEASFKERAAVDRENQELVRELRLMREDPVVMERVVADELGRVREGSVLVRFPSDSEEGPGSAGP